MRETFASELGGKGDVGAAMTDLVGVSDRVGAEARAEDRNCAEVGEKSTEEAEESNTAETIGTGTAATIGADTEDGLGAGVE